MTEYMRKIRELYKCGEENKIESVFDELVNYCKKEGIEPILFTDIAAEINNYICSIHSRN
ncbi:MAG: hypothetical protein J7J92_01710 [Candidatus Aenigmarchaeota archaeon]|nr:hypothetical protein [Candidatus Aenigmarchaeota archaeon]